ncbi:MAG: hypothetical protein KIT83_07980 [Bryobacterales bacterium]|nr:hypothetical protein [Bryobacterales bacterium]
MSQINIVISGERLGDISLLQPRDGLSPCRTASGFRVHVPLAITLISPSKCMALPSLENLHVVFFAVADGKPVEIGSASSDSFFTAPMSAAHVSLPWDWTIQAFEFYEKIRTGRDAKFGVRVSGDIRYVLVPESGHRTGREACSVPNRFFDSGEVVYSQAIWTTMMRDLNLQDVVLLELPISTGIPSDWKSVWDAVREARNSFDSGGSTAWKGTITSVRLALEEWRKVEREDQGPGWTVPSQQSLQSRTKMQRIDNLRWHLLQVAHYAAHTRADEWTREDALLVLSTICALLAARKP